MQHPSGFAIRLGHAVDVRPVDALFGNWFFWHELVHMYTAGYIVTASQSPAPARSRGCAAGGAAMSARRSRSR
jgi:hypothetical protein